MVSWQQAGTFTAAGAAVALSAAAVWVTVADDGPRGERAASAPAASVAGPRAATGGEVAPGPYAVAEFGSGWADVDRDGCDTRAEVLMRDMTREQVRDAYDGGCLVLSGGLVDPYTTGNGTVAASAVDVDHVVSKADAWVSGAWEWTRAERVAFANDPANLVATDATVNRSKGARGPDEWTPPDGRDVCDYVTRYARVKAEYGLVVTAAQRDAVNAAPC